MKRLSLTLKLITLCIILGMLFGTTPRWPASAQSNSLVFEPVADAYVDQKNPNAKNGSSTSLSVDGSPVIRTYLRFDVKGLNGQKITRAVLRLYATDGSHSGFSVAQVNSNWVEKNITFRNAPKVGKVINSVPGYKSGTWVEVDLTGAITKEGTVNLALIASADTTTFLASREAGENAPQLVLTLDTAADPTPTTVPPTATATDQPTVVVPTATATNQPTVVVPTATATSQPTVIVPTATATGQPTVVLPTAAPTRKPTTAPTTAPTAVPTTKPTTVPTSAPTQSAQPTPFGQTGTWYLKFSDDFDSSRLDLKKWEPNWLAGNDTAITKPVNSNELSCYDPAQVSVENGSLKLTAVQRSCRANNGVTYNYASGLVNTRRHFTFSYGYMEARVWLDGSTKIANWPAFWANGTGKWPTTGEIDVFEGLNGRPSWHYHWDESGDHKSAGGYPGLSNPVGWHIFAAEWQPGSVKFYYDGQYVGQATQGIASGPMYLILNYGISSTISPPITVPSYYLVDYVRVWQRNP